MNIDIETDLILRLDTIKSLAEQLLVLDQEQHYIMMNPKRADSGLTIHQRIAFENCLDDIFNDEDNFVNITNYRKEVYEFRMLQLDGIISVKEFENKMIELETKYPFSISDMYNEDILDLRYTRINECINEVEDTLNQMIKENNFVFDNIVKIFHSHIIKLFE